MNSLKNLSLLLAMLIIEQSMYASDYSDYNGRYRTGEYYNGVGNDFYTDVYNYLDDPSNSTPNSFLEGEEKEEEKIHSPSQSPQQSPFASPIPQRAQSNSAFRPITPSQQSARSAEQRPTQFSQKAVARSTEPQRFQPQSSIGTAPGNNNSALQQNPQPRSQQSQAPQQSGRFMSAADQERYLANQRKNQYKQSAQQEYNDYQERERVRSKHQDETHFQPAPQQYRSQSPQTSRETTSRNNNSPSRNLTADTTNLINRISTQDLQAKELIEQSYFSPEMQCAVLASVGRPFKVNVITGKVSNIPTIDEIISSQPTDSKIKLNALHAALEAVQVARFYAKLNVAYDNPAYVFFAPTLSSNLFLMPSLDEDLKAILDARENDVLAALNEIPEYNSVWSWIPTDLINMFSITPRGVASQSMHTLKLEFNPNISELNNPKYENNFVTITGNTLKDLIKNFDYKQKVNVQEAANLLFKQCFIAQQPFPTEDWPLYCMPLGNTVTASNYIFDRFEVTRTKINEQTNTQFEQINRQSIAPTYARNIDELCNIISQSAHTLPHNPLQAHLLFLRIRKAVQTAMYIANKNSNFYAGYILPPAITKYLDGIVNQLIAYDKKLSDLCKNQQLGATKDDLLRDKIWTNITGFATGLGVLSAAGAAIDYTSGAGTSANIVKTTAENATYYGGKAVVNTTYYGTTIPLQAATGAVTGVVAGAQDVASGIIKGAGDFISDYTKKPNNSVSGIVIAAQPTV